MGTGGHLEHKWTRAGHWPGGKLFEAGTTSTFEGLMTRKIGSATTAKVIQRITATKGFNSNLAALTAADAELLAPLAIAQIRAQNVAADLADRADAIQY